jgi:type II secretory pathway component PulM
MKRRDPIRQELSDEQALHAAMEQKSREFSEAGAEI